MVVGVTYLPHYPKGPTPPHLPRPSRPRTEGESLTTLSVSYRGLLSGILATTVRRDSDRWGLLP